MLHELFRLVQFHFKMSDSDHDTTYENDLFLRYGEIQSVEVTGYWKYEFSLLLKTHTHMIEYTYGGNAEDIYRFDPFSVTWRDVAEGGTIGTIRVIPNLLQ